MLSIKQRQLNLRTYYYFYKGNIDGIVGNATINAIKDFQSKNGLAVDGIAGKATMTKLEQYTMDLLDSRIAELENQIASIDE